MLAFLAILLQRDLVNLFGAPTPLPIRGFSLIVIASICAVYAWFWLRVAGSDDNRRATVALVLLTGLVTAFTWIDPNRSYPFYYPYYYCAIVAGAAYPWRFGLVAVGLVATLATTVILLAGARLSVATDVVVVMILLGLGALGVRRHISNFVQLQLARDEIRRLAVNEERLRLARDLHDELGQTLSTVVLQSELVSLELPPDTSESTRRRLRQVLDSARSALQSMRELVSGFRQPTLSQEVASAGATLEAAGIKCDVTSTQLELPQPTEAALAWAVREGATNVLRHSKASRCTISIATQDGHVRLTVIDDGKGSEVLDPGQGLRGLRERIEPLGGRLSTEDLAGAGFQLTVDVPIQQ
jgi:two-component system, NarL family, sensor histidine kinase DesK